MKNSGIGGWNKHEKINILSEFVFHVEPPNSQTREKSSSKKINLYYILLNEHDVYHAIRLAGKAIHKFTNFEHVSSLFEHFWAPRQNLEAIKIATESWDITLQDYKLFITITYL